ncbi:MAG: proton-conducting transporter membrane subunit [Bacteroidales bacterium]
MNVTDVLLRVLVAAYGCAVVGALLLRPRLGRAVVAGASLVGAGSSLVLGIAVLTGAPRPTLSAPWFALAPLSFGLDALGAFFLLVVGAVALASSLYGLGYTRTVHATPLRLTGAGASLLLLTLSLQVMADNAITFLLVWEGMSLAACLLVLAEPDQEGAVSAANWYLGVTHAGFIALVAMFLLLSGGQLGQPFAVLRLAAIGAGTRHVVFALALFGFASKAGLIPLHVWLPRAHPVAPSHGSALMSGVVLKMGVYGFVRVVFDLLARTDASGALHVAPAWGVTVLALGTLSALLGVLYALMQHDLKRLLAYHSIENVGIIFMGLGAALLFQAYGLPLLAGLALVAALFHTLNHACFKGLLFLGAGAVVQATGTRNIEEMGGLIKRMPVTSFTFLVGSMAISALPPLNGFASEWLLFQALLGGVNIPAPAVALIMPVAVGLLALTSGLAAACFVKAFGITFLAIPRSASAERAIEAPMSMRAAMLVLVLLCVGLGIGAFLVVSRLATIVAVLPGLGAAAGLAARSTFFFPSMPAGLGRMSPPAVALALLLLGALVPLVLRVLSPGLGLRRSDTWGCGRLGQTPRMQYTATSFAEPLRRVFVEVYRPSEDVNVDVHPESRYFIRGITYESEVRPWIERLVYAPSLALVRRVGQAVGGVQAGSVHLYLAYLCAALIALLLAARWLP